MTTIGQLVCELYDRYLDCYRDDELAAVATKAAVDDLLGVRQPRTKRPAPVVAARTHARRAA
jgi:hypothetical protein